MIAVAYLIPVIACILLHFEFDYNGPWYTYLWTIVFGEGTVGGLHWFFYDFHTSSTEYLGSMVRDINHEESWTELVEVRETKIDAKGNSYTVTRIEERYHPEKYYFHTTRGTQIKTDYGFYSYVRNLWGLPCHNLTWENRHIKGGIRWGSRFQMSDFDYEQRENPRNWVPITEKNSYSNKVKASNSIFKFENITKEGALNLGLMDWKRKEFKDFDYISITLPLWQILTVIAVSIIENAIALYFILD